VKPLIIAVSILSLLNLIISAYLTYLHS